MTPPASDKALAAGGVLLANAEDYVPGWPLTCGWTLRRWDEHNLYFGGVQAVVREPDGTLTGGGDPRRGGAVESVA